MYLVPSTTTLMLCLVTVLLETKQRVQVLGLLSLYTEVVLWSYDVGFLPEKADLSHTITYPKDKFLEHYSQR